MLWLHLLKKYCREITVTDPISALLKWFVEMNFECKSWSQFIHDLCTMADTVEIPQWRVKIANEGKTEMIHKLLSRTIFFLYFYVKEEEPDQLVSMLLADMVPLDERESFLSFLSKTCA